MVVFGVLLCQEFGEGLALVAHHLAAGPYGGEARHHQESDSEFGVALSCGDESWACCADGDVAGCAEEAAEALSCRWRTQALGLICQLGEGLDRESAVVVSDAGEGLAGIDGEAEAGFGVVGNIVGDEFFEDRVVFLAGLVEIGEKREAEVAGDVGGDHEDDEAAAVFTHGADGVWGRVLGGHDEVGFAFPAGTVEDGDEAAVAKVLYCALESCGENDAPPRGS